MDRRTAGMVLLAGTVVAVVVALTALIAAFVTGALVLIYVALLLLVVAAPLAIGSMVARGETRLG